MQLCMGFFASKKLTQNAFFFLFNILKLCQDYLAFSRFAVLQKNKTIKTFRNKKAESSKGAQITLLIILSIYSSLVL